MASPGGRPKGTPNKIGAAVKSNVIGVFDQIGGRDRMAQWAEENPTEFYRLYARLIPTEVSGSIDLRDVSELTDQELIAIAAASRIGIAGTPEREEEPCELH